MERVILKVDAVNKTEALLALDMMKKAIKERYSDDAHPVSEYVCVANEGKSLSD